MPVALLLTHPSYTLTYDTIARGLVARGVEPVLVASERFPLTMGIRQHLDHAELLLDGRVIDSREVVGVWTKQVSPFDLPEAWPQPVRDAVRQECRVAWTAFLHAFDHASWVNPLDAGDRVAYDKPLQLRVAHAVGLNVPETLITNDPEAARAALGDDPGAWVSKLQTGANPGGGMSFTRKLRPGALGILDSLQSCPMILQRWVPKRQELRVAWIDGQSFCGALDGSIDGRMVEDWRALAPGALPWRHATLPDDVAHKLGLLMERLGLVYGGIDLIEDLDGRWWFLEVNSAGEWGMLEAELGLPIGDAVAAALTRSRA